MNIYEFDFAKALGDTIMEKYESLWLVIHAHNKDNPVSSIIGPKQLIDIFQVSHVFQYPPFPMVCGNMEYTGRLSNHGPNGMSFQFFTLRNAKQDELLLVGETCNATIRFSNF